MRSSKKAVVSLLMLSVLLLTALSVSADSMVPTGCIRVLVLQPGFWDVCANAPATAPAAGEPFFVVHGFWWETGHDWPGAIGVSKFTLELDGELLRPDGRYIRGAGNAGADPPPNIVYRQWLFNFPDGLEGTHTLTGHWTVSCSAAVEEGSYPGPCRTPN